jgi:hypothetical protein
LTPRSDASNNKIIGKQALKVGNSSQVGTYAINDIGVSPTDSHTDYRVTGKSKTNG